MRLVTTVHGWVQHTRRTPLYYGSTGSACRATRRCICVSDDLYEPLPRRAACRPSRCVLLENGIDLDEYAPPSPAAEAEAALGLPPGRSLVGAVGRLSPEKGFDLLIRAVDRLRRERPRRRAGRSPAKATSGRGWRRWSPSWAWRDRVRLLGYRPTCADCTRRWTSSP